MLVYKGILRQDNLTLLSGSIDSDGSIIKGSGFTVEKIGTGSYRITPDDLVGNLPIVMATPVGSARTASLGTVSDTGLCGEFVLC